MFNSNFWPTPRNVARGMVKELSDTVKYVLEPSAGMGHLADVIKQPYTWEEAEAELDALKPEAGKSADQEERRYRRARMRVHPDDYGRRVEIDCIESDPNFCHVLAGKEYPVVGYDWLTYNGTCYYDAILMNPPFGNGDAHLLKAWEFLYQGEIVCLLNAETLRNPFTESRKRLAKIIAENGRVTELGQCFTTAERKTDVDVVRVYLKKSAPDDEFDLWASEAGATQENNPEAEKDPDLNFVAMRDNLGNMERWFEQANAHFIKGLQEIRKGFLYMRQNKISDYSSSEKRSYSDIAGNALENSYGARADFLIKHRRDAWTSVFHQMEFHKWLDSAQQEQMLADVQRDMHLPFTAENIKNTLENVFLSRHKLFDQSVANVFDKLCSHAFENGSGPECPAEISDWRKSGWKTNDTYKVNERLVFPHGIRYDSHFMTQWDGAARLYTDLDRILCVLDAQPFDKCHTIGKALEIAVGLVNSGRKSQFTAESDYFEIRFYKKGTVHLKWKRKDLLDAFNMKAAAGKKWLGGDSSFKKAAWRGKPDYYCEHHGHNYVDGVCERCERPEVDPLSVIQCEYCRMVAEYTGREECPIHQAPVIAEPETAMLALPAPSESEAAQQVDDQDNDEDGSQADPGSASPSIPAVAVIAAAAAQQQNQQNQYQQHSLFS